MKLKRIAVAVAVTALGATVAARWRRHSAARRSSGAEADPDPDDPPCDDDVSAFIETLARTPDTGRRLVDAAPGGGATADLPPRDARDEPIARSSASPDLLRGG